MLCPGRWMGVMAAVYGLTAIIGPTLGGWITDGLGWRWIFYINLPFAALAFVAVLYALPNVRTERTVKVDWTGSALLVAGLVPLLLGFTWAGDRYAWGSPTLLGIFGFAVAVLVGFFFYERRVEEPVVSPDLFKSPIFTSTVLVALLVSMGLFGALMFIPLYFQGVLGLTATNSGEFITPMMLSFIVGSVLGGQLVTRTGRYKIQAVVGAGLTVFGMYLLSRMGVDTARIIVTRNMGFVGIGMGLAMPVLNVAIQNAFPYRLMGVVNSSQQFVTSLGGVIAAPILGTVLKNTFNTQLPLALPAELRTLVAAAPQALGQMLKDPQALIGTGALDALKTQFGAFGAACATLFEEFVRAVRVSLSIGITRLFEIGLIFAAAAFLGTFFIREIRLKQDEFYAEKRETGSVAGSASQGD